MRETPRQARSCPAAPEVMGLKFQEKGWGSTLLDRQALGMGQTDPVPVMTAAMLVSSLGYALRRELSLAISSISLKESFFRVRTLECLL